MRLVLIDDRHGRADDGRLWILLLGGSHDGRWFPADGVPGFIPARRYPDPVVTAELERYYALVGHDPPGRHADSAARRQWEYKGSKDARAVLTVIAGGQ